MASAASDPLSGIVSSEKELDCYSGLYSTRARVLEPADLEQLRRIFAHARESGRRVTLRAGGHSFDAQALGDDLVVSMMRFDAIEVFADEKRMRVGPGATWGRDPREAPAFGLVPGVTVTTANATAGGTLSGDCLSRFSPAYGKEGSWIESFDLLTAGGELLVCARPREGVPPSAWTREERAYRGVIGGLGYLGAVVAITYRVLSVGQAEGRIGVLTIVRKYKSFRTPRGGPRADGEADVPGGLRPKRPDQARRHLRGAGYARGRQPVRAALHLGLHDDARPSARCRCIDPASPCGSSSSG